MYHQFLELRTLGAVLLGLWLARLSPVVASGFGKCPNYPSMPKFNMTKFLGKWYEVERSFYLPELASGCTTMTFENTTQRDEAGRSQLEISIKSVNQWTGNPSISIGEALPESETSSIMNVQDSWKIGKWPSKLYITYTFLNVRKYDGGILENGMNHQNKHRRLFSYMLQSRLPTAIARLLPGSGRYQVLYTNYDNFAILWSCTSFVAVHADQIWLLGRERDYSTEIRKKIYNALEQLSLDPERLFIAKNKNCPTTL